MKYLAPFEVAQMLSEGIIDSFYWGTPEKEQAEKIRKAAERALSRRDLTEKYIVTVYPAVNSNTKVTHIVSVENRHHEPEENNQPDP